MDRYPLGAENAVQLEMPLRRFSASRGLVCSQALDHDSRLNATDEVYTGLDGLGAVPGLPAAASDALEADVNALWLSLAKGCDSVELLDEAGCRPSQHGERAALCLLSEFQGRLADRSRRSCSVAFCSCHSPLRGKIFGVKRWMHGGFFNGF